MALGIKETKELLKFVTDLGEGIAQATKDGVWGFTDLYHFLPAAQSVFSGIGGIDEVIDELQDLDEAELEELKQYVVDEFDISSDEAEEYVEDGVALALDLWFFVQRFFVEEDDPQEEEAAEAEEEESAEE